MAGPGLYVRTYVRTYVGCGLWVVGCGLWVVGCGLWVVGCGLWPFVACQALQAKALGDFKVLFNALYPRTGIFEAFNPVDAFATSNYDNCWTATMALDGQLQGCKIIPMNF